MKVVVVMEAAREAAEKAVAASAVVGKAVPVAEALAAEVTVVVAMEAATQQGEG